VFDFIFQVAELVVEEIVCWAVEKAGGVLVGGEVG
jgi:hypothetical protein